MMHSSEFMGKGKGKGKGLPIPGSKIGAAAAFAARNQDGLTSDVHAASHETAWRAGHQLPMGQGEEEDEEL